MCYSSDMLKKFTFERDLEHFRALPSEQKNKQIESVMEYMSKELDRIDKAYGDPMVRD